MYTEVDDQCDQLETTVVGRLLIAPATIDGTRGQVTWLNFSVEFGKKFQRNSILILEYVRIFLKQGTGKESL